MRWKQIKDILYPDPDLHKNPPLVIPACFSSIFPDACQEAWAENVMLPWIQKQFRDTYGMNMSGSDIPESTHLPDYFLDYPDSFTPVRDNIAKFLYPALLVLAVIGAIPCIVILLKFSSTVWSTCLYLAILIFVDLLKLFMHCGNDWYSALYGKNIFMELLVISNSVCKVTTFLMGFALYMASWTMVASGIELVIMVRFPSQLYKMCTRDRANAVILLITVLLTFINLHYFWTWAITMPGDVLEYPNDQPYCHTNKLDQTSENFNNDIAPVIDFLFVKLIPVVIVGIGLVIVAITIYRKRKRRSDESVSLLGKYFMDTSAMLEMQHVTIAICAWFTLVQTNSIIVDCISKFLPEGLDYVSYNALDFCTKLMNYLFYSLKPWLFFLLSKKVRFMIDNTVRRALFRCKRRKNYNIAGEATHCKKYISEV